jgi:hypothetical protein
MPDDLDFTAGLIEELGDDEVPPEPPPGEVHPDGEDESIGLNVIG